MAESTVTHPAVALGTDLTIANAAAMREQLLDAVDAGPGDLCLDLSAVTDFDSSAVQCLLAARHSLAVRGARLRLNAATAPVRDALRRLGLHEVLVVEAHPAGQD